MPTDTETDTDIGRFRIHVILQNISALMLLAIFL